MNSIVAIVATFAMLGLYPSMARAAVAPCSVLTVAQASKALGQPVVRTQERNVGHAACSYRSARFSSLVVTVERLSSPSEAAREYDAQIAAPGMQQTPSAKLSGIGDRAQRLGATVLVLQRNSIYGFTIVAPDASSTGPLRVIEVLKTAARGF